MPQPADDPPRLPDIVRLPETARWAWSSHRRAFRPCGVAVRGRVLAGLVHAWVLTDLGWAAHLEVEDPQRGEGATRQFWALAGPGLLRCRPVAPDLTGEPRRPLP